MGRRGQGCRTRPKAEKKKLPLVSVLCLLVSSCPAENFAVKSDARVMCVACLILSDFWGNKVGSSYRLTSPHLPDPPPAS